MGRSLDLVKTLAIPAVISLSLYLLFGYLIIPFFRRYHQRYAQYLPLNSISAHTSTLRERIADSLMHFFLPSTWRLRLRRGGGEDNNDAISIFDEEGEHMAAMDIDAARREALEARRSASEAQMRLSRDLEEGFMDDSEEEGTDHRR
ncbi:hypothetical protein BGW36DRAFT_74597 [Talaromyces proteolyticus]|uniref:Uncharacterized protein n=1 Tax=Talaromyces proteolyticus TaxID=1131652 RepID=A0AAD4PUR1_9EURO|nr:uncharacterized protein BGW36DRAFT_74597 [Talaromyces proteolyticus]KAH8689672.1 hypothetical protein BGW36DRAFT_74597 [Talaromyces proteolyticus]